MSSPRGEGRHQRAESRGRTRGQAGRLVAVLPARAVLVAAGSVARARRPPGRRRPEADSGVGRRAAPAAFVALYAASPSRPCRRTCCPRSQARCSGSCSGVLLVLVGRARSGRCWPSRSAGCSGARRWSGSPPERVRASTSCCAAGGWWRRRRPAGAGGAVHGGQLRRRTDRRPAAGLHARHGRRDRARHRGLRAARRATARRPAPGRSWRPAPACSCLAAGAVPARRRRSAGLEEALMLDPRRAARRSTRPLDRAAGRWTGRWVSPDRLTAGRAGAGPRQRRRPRRCSGGGRRWRCGCSRGCRRPRRAAGPPARAAAAGRAARRRAGSSTSPPTSPSTAPRSSGSASGAAGHGGAWCRSCWCCSPTTSTARRSWPSPRSPSAPGGTHRRRPLAVVPRRSGRGHRDHRSCTACGCCCPGCAWQIALVWAAVVAVSAGQRIVGRLPRPALRPARRPSGAREPARQRDLRRAARAGPRYAGRRQPVRGRRRSRRSRRRRCRSGRRASSPARSRVRMPLPHRQGQLAQRLPGPGTDDGGADDPAAAVHDEPGEAVVVALGDRPVDVGVRRGDGRAAASGRRRPGRRRPRRPPGR